MADSTRKEVFTVTEYQDGTGDQKSWWSKIGTAFVNRDGSLNVILDALPVNGRLNIRDPLPPRDEAQGNGGQAAPAATAAGNANRRPSQGAARRR